MGGAKGHQGGDGLPAGCRGVDLAGGADLQGLPGRRDRGGPPGAVPARRRRVGRRLQDRRHHRPAPGHPPRQPRAGQGRPAVRALAGQRGRPLLPARGGAGRPGDRASRGGHRPRRPLPGPTGRRGGRGRRTAAHQRIGDHPAGRGQGDLAGALPSRRGRAGGLLRLLHAPADRLAAFQTVDWTVALDWLGRTTGATLAPEQAAAVRLALTERVAVLTGGPGCGKSYTVRAIVTLARAKRAKVILAAPTGRAAKRLSELAGMEAATLHRLLQLRPGGDAAFDREHPLDADLVVVDEASMLDVLLANKLVKAVPPGAHLLLVGDVDQLPSVGPGEVLRDLLAAATLPRVRLTQIFRQAQRSGVVTNAHRINAGHQPLTRGLPDFFLFAQDDPEQAADLVVDVVANRLPRRFSLDPRRDVQVLCPMHRGPAGAGALNERLQTALTPARPGLAERRFGGRVYRVGDKVMQIRNNYDKGTAGVFNGSVGVVTTLSLEDQQLRVLLDEDEEVGYGFDELDELTHAYAVSIHRSQGSEYPCVVVPLVTGAWNMLARNLLYTAVTRARQLVVLVGSRRALAKAVRTQGAGRYTALGDRLCRRLAWRPESGE